MGNGMTINFSAVRREGLLGRVLRAPLTLVPRSATMRVLQGPLRGAHWIAGSGNHGYWLGSYELSKQIRFAESLSVADVVFDIGANVGFYTVLASRLVTSTGRVYAFEPLPHNLGYLRRHVAKNALQNVAIIAAAVAASPGRARFTAAVDRSQARLDPSGEIEVDVVAIDELVASNQLALPQIVKIDVEGAEFDVLQGMIETLRTAAPIIFLATHGSDVHARCLALLYELGYAVTPLNAGKPDELVAVQHDTSCLAGRFNPHAH
jgi:FkbM family methyltransferase